MDATVDQLLAVTLNHIARLQGQKAAFVGAEALAAGMQPPPGPEQGGQGMASPAAAPGMPPNPSMGENPPAPGAAPAPETNSGTNGMPPEVYDQLVGAVRQVLQEMGVAPGAEAQPAQAPAAAPAQGGEQPAAHSAPAAEKPKSKGKGGVDPEEFAKLQSAVAMILEQLGMVSAGDGMQPAQPEGATAMGANPGQSAELPPEAVPLAGPLDPNAGQAMGAAGQQARVRASRVGKLASLLRGPR